MSPCSTLCPQGQCANCVDFGLPLDVARCEPIQCAQSDRCARALDRPSRPVQVVDASSCLAMPGSWCPMFIDARGLNLRQAA